MFFYFRVFIFYHSKFDVGRSMFDVHLFIDRLSSFDIRMTRFIDLSPPQIF
jgi:hypothetical protein